MSNISEVKVSISEIGEAKIVLKPSIRNYLFNGKAPISIPIDYYQELYEKFESNLLLHIREGITVEIVEAYIKRTKDVISKLISVSDGHRVHYLFSVRDKVLSEDAEYTHDNIVRIISTQKAVLNRVLLKLYDVNDLVKAKVINENKSIEIIPDKETSLIPFKDVGRATFKMSKKQALMFLYVLEKEGLLLFENEIQRTKFIEGNFNYTEMRENKLNFEEACEMKGVGKEFSNFDAYTDGLKNNTSLKKLQQKLIDTFHMFEFKTTRS